MATKRRSSREPEVATDSPFAPAIAEMRRVARMLGVSVAAADADDSPQATAVGDHLRGKIEGIEIAVQICQRAAAGEVAFTDDGQHLVKLERPARAPATPEQLEERVAVVEAKVRVLESKWLAPEHVLEAERRGEKRLAAAHAKATPATSATLARGSRRVLVAIAQTGNRGATMSMISLVTGYKATSRRTYLGALLKAGAIARDGARFVATPKGRAELGADFVPLPTGAALRDHLLATLPAGEQSCLRVILARYPNVASREDVHKATGYKATSIRTYTGKLSAREVLVVERAGYRASANLFDDGADK
jgi:hypothetical protein